LLTAGILISVEAWAQPEGEVRPEEEVARALAALDAFRNQRLPGDFAFKFDLRHLPRRGRETVYNGQMWGTWNRFGPLTRVRLDAPESEEAPELDFLIQNGVRTGAWSTVRSAEETEVRALHGAALFAPLLNDVVYTPFDLQMPFVFWKRFIYEGETRRKGRPVFAFLMYPPVELEGASERIGSVRIFLDQKFNALVRAEIMDPEGTLKKTFKIVSFKKIQDQWIVKSVDLVDEVMRNKTRFSVVAAALGQNFHPDMFAPESLGKAPEPAITPDAFQFL
jgi:hypothetical protein